MSTRLHDAEDKVLFPTFAPEVVEEMMHWGTVEQMAPGGVLFTEGQRNYDFFVVLDGTVRVTKRVGGEDRLLAIHHPGEFAGEIGILTHGPAISTARATGEARVLRISADVFRQLSTQCTPLGETAVQAMSARTREVDASLRQQEKLTALGRMAAGLAHELNNPASAARRAAQELHEAVGEAQRRALDYDRRFSDRQRAMLCMMHDQLRRGEQPSAANALARSDDEDAVALWLDERGVPDAWDKAPPLVHAGMKPATVQALDAEFDGEALRGAVDWLASTLSLTGLAGELEGSAARISALVGSIKEYSYMDRGKVQWLNVHDTLESTLRILNHKLRDGITLHREFAPELPLVCASGSELNQVWTNLIDNAVQAMAGRGNLWVRTVRDGDAVRVEIEDDGPGIPADVLPRIWEPFFTTKGVGEGTGLGLDIARRIVERGHGGDIRVSSRPGQTRFSITLLIEPPKRDA